MRLNGYKVDSKGNRLEGSGGGRKTRREKITEWQKTRGRSKRFAKAYERKAQGRLDEYGTSN